MSDPTTCAGKPNNTNIYINCTNSVAALPGFTITPTGEPFQATANISTGNCSTNVPWPSGGTITITE